MRFLFMPRGKRKVSKTIQNSQIKETAEETPKIFPNDERIFRQPNYKKWIPKKVSDLMGTGDLRSEKQSPISEQRAHMVLLQDEIKFTMHKKNVNYTIFLFFVFLKILTVLNFYTGRSIESLLALESFYDDDESRLILYGYFGISNLVIIPILIAIISRFFDFIFSSEEFKREILQDNFERMGEKLNRLQQYRVEGDISQLIIAFVLCIASACMFFTVSIGLSSDEESRKFSKNLDGLVLSIWFPFQLISFFILVIRDRFKFFSRPNCHISLENIFKKIIWNFRNDTTQWKKKDDFETSLSMLSLGRNVEVSIDNKKHDIEAKFFIEHLAIVLREINSRAILFRTGKEIYIRGDSFSPSTILQNQIEDQLISRLRQYIQNKKNIKMQEKELNKFIKKFPGMRYQIRFLAERNAYEFIFELREVPYQYHDDFISNLKQIFQGQLSHEGAVVCLHEFTEASLEKLKQLKSPIESIHGKKTEDSPVLIQEDMQQSVEGFNGQEHGLPHYHEKKLEKNKKPWWKLTIFSPYTKNTVESIRKALPETIVWESGATYSSKNKNTNIFLIDVDHSDQVFSFVHYREQDAIDENERNKLLDLLKNPRFAPHHNCFVFVKGIYKIRLGRLDARWACYLSEVKSDGLCYYKKYELERATHKNINKSLYQAIEKNKITLNN